MPAMNATGCPTGAGWQCTPHTAHGFDVCSRRSDGPIAATAALFPVADASGNVFVSEQQLVARVLSHVLASSSGAAQEPAEDMRPLLARLPAKLLRDALNTRIAGGEAPCAEGWSRIDSLFLRGAECDVPTGLRDAAGVLCCVFGTVTLFCMLYQLMRKRAKNDTRSTMYRSISLGFNTWCCLVLWSGNQLLHGAATEYDNRVSLCLYVAFVVLTCESACLTAQAFLNHATDTIYALRPAMATKWHGYTALMQDTVRPVYFIGVCYSGISIGMGVAAHDDAAVHNQFTVHC